MPWPADSGTPNTASTSSESPVTIRLRERPTLQQPTCPWRSRPDSPTRLYQSRRSSRSTSATASSSSRRWIRPNRAWCSVQMERAAHTNSTARPTVSSSTVTTASQTSTCTRALTTQSMKRSPYPALRRQRRYDLRAQGPFQSDPVYCLVNCAVVPSSNVPARWSGSVRLPVNVRVSP